MNESNFQQVAGFGSFRFIHPEAFDAVQKERDELDARVTAQARALDDAKHREVALHKQIDGYERKLDALHRAMIEMDRVLAQDLLMHEYEFEPPALAPEPDARERVVLLRAALTDAEELTLLEQVADLEERITRQARELDDLREDKRRYLDYLRQMSDGVAGLTEESVRLGHVLTAAGAWAGDEA